MDTEYDCKNCGQPLQFDSVSLHFRHKALFPACHSPLACAVQVLVGVIVLPAS